MTSMSSPRPNQHSLAYALEKQQGRKNEMEWKEWKKSNAKKKLLKWRKKIRSV